MLKQLSNGPLTVDEDGTRSNARREAEQLNSQYKSLLQEKKQAITKIKAERNRMGRKSERRRITKTLTGKDKALVEQRNISSWAAKFT